jgi:hypothetical protein
MLDTLKTIPTQHLLFFGFMSFFLWTTICCQCLINAQTRAGKQVWALMLFTATWTLLVIHVQSMGLYR